MYTPTYFNLEHTYCAREYKAMEDLEISRLKLLPNPRDKAKGLIIPIVIRGFDNLPSGIKDSRQCHDFSGFLASDTKMHKHHKYSPEITRIATYIAARCAAFKGITSDPCASPGGKFSLPNGESIKTWIEGMMPTALHFPGRESD